MTSSNQLKQVVSKVLEADKFYRDNYKKLSPKKRSLAKKILKNVYIAIRVKELRGEGKEDWARELESKMSPIPPTSKEVGIFGGSI